MKKNYILVIDSGIGGVSILKKLKQGVKIRILTVDPDSEFLRIKSIEEGSVPESISKTIKDLISWASDLNKKNDKSDNGIVVKTYNSLPLFSYQRIDEHVFVGPNLYGKSSQKSISYEYYNGKGADYFINYFDVLWNDDSFCKKVDL